MSKYVVAGVKEDEEEEKEEEGVFPYSTEIDHVVSMDSQLNQNEIMEEQQPF